MKNIVILLSLLVSSQFFAQDLNSVTIDELTYKQSKIDIAAVAEVIFSKGLTSFFVNGDSGYTAETEMSFKIKIFKKEGFEFANVTYPYYNEGNRAEKISISSAVTYNLVDGKIEKTKLKSSDEFVVKESENWKTKKFVLPNVKEGSVIEYKIKLITPFIWNLNTWDFQKEIPVIYSYYKFKAPEVLKYQHFIKGFHPIEIKNTPEYYEYIAQKVKPIKDEAYVNNIDNYTTSLRLELASFLPSNGIIENFSNTWESLIKKIYDADFGKELNRTKYFGNDLQTIIKDKTHRDDKIAAIFSYVQSNLKWNEKYGYNPDLGVREAYKTKTGNVADINLILIAMLREAGLTANPILLSTRSNGVALFPSHSAFNYVIACVEIDNGLILLDATSKYSKPNILPIRALNWVGRVIRESGSSALVELYPSVNSIRNSIYTIDLHNDGSITGNKRSKLSNYYSFLYRDRYALLNTDAIVKKIQENYKNIEIEEYTNANVKNLNLDIEETYKFKVSNAIDIIGNQIFFEPSFVFNISANPFLDEERKFPIDFVFIQKDIMNFVINIPNGYEVEYLPKSMSIRTASNNFSVKWVLAADATKISLRITEDTNKQVILSDEYLDLKYAYDQYVKIDNEKIILKKVI